MIGNDEPKNCNRCKKIVPARLVRQYATNGAVQVMQQCPYCHNSVRTGGAFVRHSELKVEIETIPIVADYRTEYGHMCEFYGCEDIATEMHHWAPRHLFIHDADKWPVSYLCKYHHKLWHDVVTPAMCEVKHV